MSNETPDAPGHPGYDMHGDADPELYTHTLASIVIKNGDVPPKSLNAAIVKWREQFFAGGQRNLAEVLAEQGSIRRVQIPLLLKATKYALCRREDKIFGKRAYRRGLITKTQLDESLAFQKQLFKALHEVKRLETILIDDGFLKPDDTKKIWAEFTDYKGSRRPSNKPANAVRAARSAGVALDELEVEEDGDDDVPPPAVPSPDESGGGSAMDIESLKAEVGGAAAAAAAEGASGQKKVITGEDDEDPAEMMSAYLPPAPEIGEVRPDRKSEKDAWKEKKREEAARLAREEVAEGHSSIDISGDEDDFSDDNMNSALDGTISEIDLTDDFKRNESGEKTPGDE
ncbi:MAG: hypothetical protein AB7S36_23355 [Planctomycetota bacterium]